MAKPTLRAIDTDGTVYTRKTDRPYQVVLVTVQTEAAWRTRRSANLAYLASQVREYHAKVLVLQALERGETQEYIAHNYVAAAALRDMKASSMSYNMMKAGVKTELDSVFFGWNHPIMERTTSQDYAGWAQDTQRRHDAAWADQHPRLETIVTWHLTAANATRELAKRQAWGEKTFRFLSVEPTATVEAK